MCRRCIVHIMNILRSTRPAVPICNQPPRKLSRHSFTMASATENTKERAETDKAIPEQSTAASKITLPNAGGTAYKPKLDVIPLRHTKTVHLIRHGQGYHNVYGEANEAAYKSGKYTDAHLTRLGWQQADKLGEHLRALLPSLQPEVVIVSPLRRTLETAVGIFGGGPVLNGDAAATELLMVAMEEEPEVVTAHAAIARGTACPPIIAAEACREHIGEHPCDRRRPISEQRRDFPGVDFSLIESDEDVLWKPDERETDEEIGARGERFFQSLMQRPEGVIAVVAHSGFLRCTSRQFAHAAAPIVKDELHRWYDNCELRTVVLYDQGGGGGLDRTWWHPKGHHKQSSQ